MSSFEPKADRVSRFGIACLALGSLLVSACSGARSHVVAPDAEYPISLSDGMRGSDGQLLADEEKKVVGYFNYDYKAWGMWWRIFSFTGDEDISEAVNEQVKAAGGQAIIDLDVKSENCTWNAITFIGLFPDCAGVKVRGNIIRAEPIARAEAPAAPAKAGRPAAPPAAAPAPAAPAAEPPAPAPATETPAAPPSN